MASIPTTSLEKEGSSMEPRSTGMAAAASHRDGGLGRGPAAEEALQRPTGWQAGKWDAQYLDFDHVDHWRCCNARVKNGSKSHFSVPLLTVNGH